MIQVWELHNIFYDQSMIRSSHRTILVYKKMIVCLFTTNKGKVKLLVEHAKQISVDPSIPYLSNKWKVHKFLPTNELVKW